MNPQEFPFLYKMYRDRMLELANEKWPPGKYHVKSETYDVEINILDCRVYDWNENTEILLEEILNVLKGKIRVISLHLIKGGHSFMITSNLGTPLKVTKT